MPPGGIQTHNLSMRMAADLRLDHADTGTGRWDIYWLNIGMVFKSGPFIFKLWLSALWMMQLWLNVKKKKLSQIV